jgi:hypothetical protein
MPQLLHLSLSHPAKPNLLCTEEQLYFLDSNEYTLLKSSGKLEVLENAEQINKEEVRQMICTKRFKEIRLLNVDRKLLYELSFENLAHYRKFIGQMYGMKKQKDERKKRINPTAVLFLMLLAYAFIWAGTRPTPEDIDPEGIRWKLAGLVVLFMKWLNLMIGQRAILIIGILGIVGLLLAVFWPEMKGRKVEVYTK